MAFYCSIFFQASCHKASFFLNHSYQRVLPTLTCISNLLSIFPLEQYFKVLFFKLKTNA
jgi:hypothetical protein